MTIGTGGVKLEDRVLDLGLNVLDTEATHIFVNSQQPTTFTQAVATYGLGYKSFGAGSAFGAPGAWTSGRKTSSVAITDGTITTAGTVACWSAVDNTNSRLLAAGDLTGGGAVTAGQSFSLGSFDVQMQKAGMAAGAYTGPGDLYSFAHWYGLRAYSAAKIGSAAVRIFDYTIDSGDTTPFDLVTQADGSIDTTPCTVSGRTINDEFRVITLYDQVASGGVNLNPSGPTPVLFHANSKIASGGPTGTLDAQAQYGGGNVNSGGIPAVNQPFIVSAVVMSRNAPGGNGFWASLNSDGKLICQFQATGADPGWMGYSANYGGASFTVTTTDPAGAGTTFFLKVVTSVHNPEPVAFNCIWDNAGAGQAVMAISPRYPTGTSAISATGLGSADPVSFITFMGAQGAGFEGYAVELGILGGLGGGPGTTAIAALANNQKAFWHTDNY